MLSLLEEEEKEAREGGQRPKSAVMQAPWQPQPPPELWPFRVVPSCPEVAGLFYSGSRQSVDGDRPSRP